MRRWRFRPVLREVLHVGEVRAVVPAGALDLVADEETFRTERSTVMDAVGSERATLMGHSEGGNMSILFAATYPDRTSALVLYGTGARARRDVDYPHARVGDGDGAAYR